MFAGYRIERLLDRGGMGVVYVATEIDLDRVVALKIIAPEHTRDDTAVARFKSEARLAASLEHANIVPIHRGGVHHGVLYLAMRYVPGTNLRRVIDRGPMELPRIARIVTEIAEALDVAHERGLVHRDVKPANVLVAGEGENEHVYLTDFGLTKRVGSAADLTRSGGWVGTPDYVAPEQIQGHKVDRRADVYSLGCVLFEMLTGHVAYPKDSDMAKLWAHVTDPPPLPRIERPDLVPDFDAVVSRATAKDPDDRYATAGEMGAAVRDAVVEQDGKRRRDAGQDTSPSEDSPLAATIAEPPSAMPAPAPEPPATADKAPAAANKAPDEPAPPSEPRRGEPPRVPVAAAAAPAPAPGDGDGPSSRGRMRRGRAAALAILSLLAAGGIAAAVVLLSGDDSTEPPARSAAAKPPPGDKVSGSLGPVPTNHVDGLGTATLRLDGEKATISIDTNGLLDGAPHAMHIHAGGRGICPPGTAAKRHNGKLAISTLDGVPFYGPPVTSLTTRGSTSKKSILSLRRFPNDGNIKYRRTITLPKVVAAYIRQNNAVVVAHGADYNNNGVYDNTLDRSDLKRSLPGELTTPALCGPLKIADEVQTGSTGGSPGDRRTASSGETYLATLQRGPSADGVLCPLPDATSSHPTTT